MKHLEQKLKKRGWKEKEIHQTLKILQRTEQKKEPKTRLMEKTARILILSTSIIAVLLGAIFLTPILTIIRGTYIYPIILIIALFLGYIIDMIINKTTLIKNTFTQFITILILSMTSVYLITDFVNQLAKEYQINILHDPVSISITYSITLLIPFFAHYFMKLVNQNKNIYK